MANIRTLSVSITARTSNFTKGIARARKQLAGFASSIPLLNTSVASLGAGFAAAATAGVTYMTKQSMEQIDAAGKLADQLGLTTEQLTGYQHAANLGGVSNEELSKAFLRMEKNVSDAGNGLATSKRAIEDLGLSVEQLRAMSPDQQFRTIADAMQGVTNQSDRARIAQDLFGRSGVKLLSVIQGGSKGLSAMQAEAVRLGLTFSRDAALGVEAANDAVARAKEGLQGIANQIAIAVSPAITDLATRFTNLDLKSWGQQAGQSITEAYNATLKWAKDGNLELWFERVKAAWLGMKLVGITVWEGINGAIELFMAAAKGYAGTFVGVWTKAFAVLRKAWGTYLETIGKGMVHITGLEGVGQKLITEGGRQFAEGSASSFNAFNSDWLKEAAGHLDKAADGGERISAAFDEYMKQAQHVADLQGVVARNAQTRGIANDPLMGGILSNAIRASVEATKGVMGGVAAEAVKVASGSFEQIDLSRVSVSALAGMGRPQKTEDVNGKKQVKLLERLVQQNDEDMVAVAG